MKRFINWLTSKFSPRKASRTDLRETGSHLRRTGGHTVTRSSRPKQAVPGRQPEVVRVDSHLDGRVEESGPGKNVYIRNKYVREDTGTHETLKILDESVIETDEKTGFDPYNTGQFDRSKNWDQRSK